MRIRRWPIRGGRRGLWGSDVEQSGGDEILRSGCTGIRPGEWQGLWNRVLHGFEFAHLRGDGSLA